MRQRKLKSSEATGLERMNHAIHVSTVVSCHHNDSNNTITPDMQYLAKRRIFTLADIE